MKPDNSAPCTIILATYNLRVPCDKPPNDWASRRDRVRQTIEAGHYDVFGVQEAVKMQIDDVLRDSNYAKVGGGRDDFKNGGEHCCIFYNKTRFKLVEGGTFGKFRDKATRKTFCYYNTHLDHVSELARAEGIKMVVRHAAENGKGLPLILTGDFNAYPDSETYKVATGLLRDAAVVSRTKHRGPARTWHGWGRRTRLEPIDYIFVSDDIEVLSHVTDATKPMGLYPSDHYPVIAELRF